MPKEIITLQFGRTANFVGSHLWNFQVSRTAPITVFVDLIASDAPSL